MTTTCGRGEPGIGHSLARLRDTAPMEMTVLALALLSLAGVLVVVGIAGVAQRLPRRDVDLARGADQRAAGAILLAAAGPPLLLAAALMARPPAALADWFLVYALVGVICGGLIALARRRAQGIDENDDA